ncbi:hypothetical protein [Flavobacterium ginsenosidimutans]|uniref:hypothetical protein n=1 Tax=Flavobacterium ginsenosidimutans TaxID=687844 RepID=UPI003D96747B
MGGNAGIRGYLIQTIICVLDALDSDNQWTKVTLEPLDTSEKVDIRWIYPEKIKVTQVKSSQNIIRLSDAKRWCKELVSNTPNMDEYELIVVGHPEEKLHASDQFEGVNISKVQSLDTDNLIDIASTKIDAYYESHGKTKMSSGVREILVKTLTLEFGTNSILGKEVTRSEFDQLLLEWIATIEKQIETNPFTALAPPSTIGNKPFNIRIAKKILDLVGWTNFSEKLSVSIYNDKIEEEDVFSVDFFGDFESKLKTDTRDAVLVTSIHDLTYPITSKKEILNYVESSDKIFDDLLQKSKIPFKNYGATDYHNILFWLTTENSEVNQDFIHHAKDNYRKEILNDQMSYYLIDNNKAIFLISSIVTAKNYREGLAVKFLYPITEANQAPGQIGKRGTRLPAQFINSSVIPVIKESSDKISILLFCSDPFSEDALKKLIWLTIRLTSGLGNEYLLYFADFDESDHNNLASEVIRSFDDEILENKIQVMKYSRIDANALDTVLHTGAGSSILNETYDELKSQSTIDSKHLNEAFINILPYGDILKPFLKTDAITANDMRIFLAKKGIFVKSADRSKLIGLMSCLLFSPKELEDFKTLIDIKDRPTNTTNEIFQIKHNNSLENVFKSIRPNFDNLTEKLNTKLLDLPAFRKNPNDPDEFILDVRTERKDPTSQVSVNTLWGRIEILCKKEDDALVVNRINTVSREDKVIAKRVVTALEAEFKRTEFIKEETIRIMFSSFVSNADRVNFLLSFTNISSSIFREPEIKSIKFKFDDGEDIPEAFKDKKDKDLITYFSGRNLTGINEISDEDFKKVLLLEEIYITYKYDYINLKNGFYSVKFNFSDALKNKPVKDGVFKSEPNLYMSAQVKKLANIDRFKRELSKEIERIKLEKLKQFNIIE